MSIRSNRDVLGEQMMATFSQTSNWATRPSRKPGRRGPVPQWTESIKTSIAPDVGHALRIAASRRSISVAGLIRQIFDAWLKANPEAWK